MRVPESKKSDSNSSKTDQTTAGSQINGEETGLGQYIWKRYDHASGFTTRRFQLSFARRHPLAGNLRLPLLSAVQKRWGSAEDFYSGRPAVSAYTWRSGVADLPYEGSRPGSMRFKRQPGGDDPVDKERVRPPGEKKAATIRPQTLKTPPGAESNQLQAYRGRQDVNPPFEAGMIRRVVPTISAGEKIRTTDPLQTGVIDQHGRGDPGAVQLANSKRSHTYDLPVVASPERRTGRMEAPILQRRKKSAARHDSKLAAVPQPQGSPLDNRTAGSGSQSDVRASAKMSPTTGILRPASGNLGTAIIQRIQHHPGVRRKLSAAGPAQMSGNQEGMRRQRSGRPISSGKASNAVVMPKKIVGATDTAEVSFLPTTVKTKTDSREQSTHRNAGQHVLAPVNGLVSTSFDGSGTVSGGSGLMAPSTDATRLTSKDPAEDNRRQFVIETETGNGLAADILQRHGRIPASRLIGAKTEQTRIPVAVDGKPTTGIERKLRFARIVSENIVSKRSEMRRSGGSGRSVAETIASLSVGYLHPSTMATHPNGIVRGDTRQNGLLPLSAVSGSPQSHPAVTAFAENRTRSQMMIHRTFTPVGAAGSTGSGSNATEYTANTFLERIEDRPLAMLERSTHGFDALNMIPKAGRFAHSTAGDPAGRPVVQLFASDRPVFAPSRSMRSSEVQSGGTREAESRPLEPRGGSSENETAGPIDIEQLVEKVLNQLMRRIAVERERRGLQRWP